ncbi:hypothetical protein FHS72_002400 [Loktanella ponticola]|uniref:Uncharacterized protein n=1 Tax=Yoonia ponticola TaxID=1524255 RepID=A0A7W9F029_9RHOB|nr:hypothetical protein [Yoonia ponticola]MBB5722770.1 hypothetical protein [Yoonia ponticola]
MLKAIVALFLTIIAGPTFADGVSSGALSEPTVVPIIRVPAPALQAPLVAPMRITQTQRGQGYCHNSQNSGPTESLYGYEVKLACDHILVGAGILGVMFMLGASSSTN